MASKYDSTSLKTYDNEVLATKLENQLTTRLDMNQFTTVDYTLSENAGMVKRVRTYSGTGDVEDLTMGKGNTKDIGAGYTDVTYEVVTTQGRVPYYDEQMMNDPAAVDAALTRLTVALTNDLTAKVVAELDKATNIQYSTTFSFDNIVDAVASFPDEQVDGLFMLVNKADAATIRKALKDSLQYVTDYVRTGYIGTVAGVNVIETAAVEAGTAYIANKEAVTTFIKKGVEVEQEREPNERKNIVYGRVTRVTALTDATKVVKLTTTAKA